RVAKRFQLAGSEHRVRRGATGALRVETVRITIENRYLVRSGGAGNTDLQQESVELCLRQRIRTLVLDRILRGKDGEQRPERPGLAIYGHLSLLHRLQQRRLRLRRRTVDLVGEEQVREHGPGNELEPALRLAKDAHACDVGRYQVRRELDTPETRAERPGERPDQQGLGDTRYALEQYVPSSQHGHQSFGEGVALPDYPGRDGVVHALECGGDRGGVHGRSSGCKGRLGHDGARVLSTESTASSRRPRSLLGMRSRLARSSISTSSRSDGCRSATRLRNDSSSSLRESPA